MTCNGCIHWIGEPIDYCELGPNQYPLCVQAEEEEEDDPEADA